MKHFLFVVLGIAFAVSAEAADVGVSISVGQPGFYGRIDIGDSPQPEVIYQKPVVIARPPRDVKRKPMYVHVPPGHEKNWKKHCKKYNACGHPVYFVRDRWYEDVYVPEYRKRHGHGEHERDHGRGHGQDNQGEHGRRGNHKK